MALTISQIMNVSWPAVVRGHRVNYYVTEPMMMPNAQGYHCAMYEPRSGLSIPIVWSFTEDVKVRKESERINFVRALLDNAIYALNYAIAQREEEQDLPDLQEEMDVSNN